MTEPLLINNQELTWRGLPVYQRYELYIGEFGTALADVFQMDPAHYIPFAVLASAHSVRYNFDAPLQEKFSFGVGASERYSFGEALA